MEKQAPFLSPAYDFEFFGRRILPDFSARAFDALNFQAPIRAQPDTLAIVGHLRFKYESEARSVGDLENIDHDHVISSPLLEF